MEKMDFAVSAIFGAREIISIVNTVSDRVVFLKHEDAEVPLNRPMGLTEYVHSYLATQWVHPADRDLFEIFLEPALLRDFCRSQKNGVLFTFRRKKDGGIRWARFLVNVPEDYSDQDPEVLLCMRYLSEKEADEHDASRVVSQSIRKVVKYDHQTDTFRTLKLPKGEEGLRSRYRAEPTETNGWPDEEPFVHPDDLEEFRAGIQRENMLAWFQAGNAEKEVFYRRKMGGRFKWVKLIIHPASDYTTQTPRFLFYIVDVHNSMVTFNSNQNRSDTPGQRSRSVDLESYYDNVLHALSYFTQQYVDFYIVDMTRDRYIKYKVDRQIMSGSIPSVGCYSELAARAMTDTRNLSFVASLEELRQILEDKVSFDYTFNMPDGKRYRTICTRIESDHGVPTKMIARTIRVEDEDRLKVKTFGSFEVYDRLGRPIAFTKKKSKQLLAYLVDKYGFPAATADIVMDVLEKDVDDLNAKKYVSTLFRSAARDLEQAGYTGIILKEWNSLRVDVDRLDCDYYHLMQGDASYWGEYHNEYMKEYSWAEETNAEILHYGGM